MEKLNNKINYQKELDKIIKNIESNNSIPKLFLHSCCAPCSSYVMEYLSNYFEITLFYYNPNIYPKKEYSYRINEQKKFIEQINNNNNTKNKIDFIEGKYNTEEFYKVTKGLENISEGGNRCFKCYEMRLKKTAKYAKENNFDYFTTTLSISPHKNSQILNEIGKKISNELNIKYLFSDFKKKNGYNRSIQLSEYYGLYRQKYCGCIFSKIESENRINKK